MPQMYLPAGRCRRIGSWVRGHWERRTDHWNKVMDRSFAAGGRERSRIGGEICGQESLQEVLKHLWSNEQSMLYIYICIILYTRSTCAFFFPGKGWDFSSGELKQGIHLQLQMFLFKFLGTTHSRWGTIPFAVGILTTIVDIFWPTSASIYDIWQLIVGQAGRKLWVAWCWGHKPPKQRGKPKAVSNQFCQKRVMYKITPPQLEVLHWACHSKRNLDQDCIGRLLRWLERKTHVSVYGQIFSLGKMQPVLKRQGKCKHPTTLLSQGGFPQVTVGLWVFKRHELQSKPQKGYIVVYMVFTHISPAFTLNYLIIISIYFPKKQTFPWLRVTPLAPPGGEIGWLGHPEEGIDWSLCRPLGHQERTMTWISSWKMEKCGIKWE